MKREVRSLYDPSAPDYTFSKEENESAKRLNTLLENSDAVKKAGIKLTGPTALREALMVYSKDYLTKKVDASKDGNSDPFEDRDEFTAMWNYATAVENLDVYNANEANRKKILEDKIFNNSEYKSLVVDRNGKKDIVTSSDVAKIMPKEVILSERDGSGRITVSSQQLADAFVQGKLGGETSLGDFYYNGKAYYLHSVDGDKGDGVFNQIEKKWNGFVYDVLEPKYGNSADFNKLYKKVNEETVPDLLYYKTRTGQMGVEFSYNFDPKKRDDKAFLIFNEALNNPANATIYVTDASGKSTIADDNISNALRQLLGQKEEDAEKLVGGFKYKTQGVDGKPTVFFSLGAIPSETKSQVGGVNLDVLNQKSFSLVISPTATGPTLSDLPANTGMQVYQSILRGKSMSSDPVLSAAGFNFTLVPNDNENPTNVRLNLNYNLVANERDPKTGEIKKVTKPIQDSRPIELVGPNAKSPDEIVSYLYGLFRESMALNRQRQLEYEAAIKANPGTTTVDRDQLFRKIFGDNFVK